MKTTRRDFIKISAVGAGGLALSTPAFNFFGPNEEPMDDTKAKRFPTYCEVCFWKCAAWTYVNQEGKVWKVIGNENDQHSEGRLCTRGTGGVGMHYDEDRLKHPLIRRTVNGEQVFEKASWDEAFEYITQKLKKIKGKYGGESIAMFTHGSGTELKTLVNALGSKTITKPSYAQCRGPREAAWIATFGTGVGSPEPIDIENTDCLVLIGSHIGENMHKGPVQEVSRLIDRGGSIITVDPRFSTIASKSTYWMPIKPATDLALLLAWIHVIIEEELYDKAYVEKYTYGLEQLKAHVKDKTPEWAFGITKLEPEKIRETARAMGKAAPKAVIHPGRHVTWYGDDSQRLRAVAILNALLGAYGRKGGIFLADKIKAPKFPHPAFPKPKWNWKSCFPGKYPLASEIVANAVRDASIPKMQPKHLYKAWIINGTNLTQTLPDQKRTLEALDALELVVVIDTMPMEITGYADVVLPECTYLERFDDLRVSKHRKPQIALRMPAVEPRWDTKPDWWIARELGHRMGLEEYFKWEKFEEVLDWRLKKIGSSLEEMKNIGVKTWEREYDDLYFQPNEEVEFNTNTGKIELYSTSFQENGFDPLPNYTPHPEPEAGFFRLNYGRAPMHTFSRTANNPNLNDLMNENKLWVNPRAAKDQGLKSDQLVWLENQDGIVSKYPIKVRVTERTRWDSVYMVHGFGHTNEKLTRAHGKGASDSDLISKPTIDPVMGGTGMRGNFVKILQEEPKKEAKS